MAKHSKSEQRRIDQVAILHRYKAAFKALHGHDVFVGTSGNNAWHYIDSQPLRTHEVLARAERLEKAVAARMASKP